MRGFVRRFVVRGALAGLVLLFAVLMSGYERETTEELWWADIDWSSVEITIPRDYEYPYAQPHSPESDPSMWSSTEREAWDLGLRSCQRSWGEVVSAAGLSDWIDASRPWTPAQLEWVAGRLAAASPFGPLDQPFLVKGCLNGLASFRKSGSAPSGRDELP